MKRRPNFTVAEMDALIDAIAERHSIVSNSFPGRVTKSVKEREWLTITDKVNETSALHRTVAEVRKKWKNLRMVTKAKKEAMLSDIVQLCKTGDPAGGVRQLSPVEARVMEILDGAGVSLPPPIDALGATVKEESDSNASASMSCEDEELAAASASEILVSNATAEEADCAAPEAAATLAAGRQCGSKPSILSVVEALQKRLQSDAVPATGRAAVSGSSSCEEPEDNDCGCCCHGERLLAAEERRLLVEREKVVALREIVATLRDVAAAMKSTVLANSPGAELS